MIQCNIRRQRKWAICNLLRIAKYNPMDESLEQFIREENGDQIWKRTQWELLGCWQRSLYRSVWWLHTCVHFVIIPSTICSWLTPFFCLYVKRHQKHFECCTANIVLSLDVIISALCFPQRKRRLRIYFYAIYTVIMNLIMYLFITATLSLLLMIQQIVLVQAQTCSQSRAFYIIIQLVILLGLSSSFM